MLALSLLLTIAAQLPSEPPLVSSEVTPARRGARLLDAESQAKLVELDAREAALKPTDKQNTFKTLGIISATVALLPVAAAVVGMFVGLFVGAAAYGFLGALAGLIVGAAAVIVFIPWPFWLAAAALGVLSGVSFGVANGEGADNRRELNAIRAERRAILHPTPMATIGTF